MSTNLILIGLVFNFIGTILLSIPTVNGMKYLTSIIEFIKTPFIKINRILVILLIIWIILNFWNLDSLFIAIFIDKDISIIELIVIIYRPLIILLSLITVIWVLIYFLDWLKADYKNIKEKEKRAGALGILLILIGFAIQIIDTLYN